MQGRASADLVNTPLSSQSLAPLPEWMELFEEDTELRLRRLVAPYSRGSVFTNFPCFGLELGLPPLVAATPAAAAAAAAALESEALLCFRALLPARSSSNLRGLGLRWVRS
jgi:hypothetical protein